MLTETNRAGIRNSLKQWSRRKNIPDEVLNDFIELALSKANRALRIPPLETVNDFEITTDGYILIPSDFIEVKEIIIQRNNKNIILERKSIQEVDYMITSGSGDPCIYGRYGNTFRVAPYAGDGTETLRMYYYFAIPPMQQDITENWFTLTAPEILLYGAMSELCNYTRDIDGTQLWTTKFNEAVQILQTMEDRAAWWSGGPVAISLGGSH